MEVDKSNFMFHLIPLLDAISRAELVSFDLEMSGIGARTRYGRNDRAQDVGKPDLQQQYAETRDAAMKFQVLQLGLTCVAWEGDQYIARPYNINVSPLFDDMKDNLGLDRHFTFSSSASQFLIRNNFDIAKPFNSGVSYLSMAEEREAYDIYSSRNDKSEIPDLPMDPNSKTLEFYRNSRAIINKWIRQTERSDFCNIPDGGPTTLDGFQRRLVYQLVRKEFPEYRAFAVDGGRFMQVKKFDRKREEQFQEDRKARFDAMVAKQIGLRFIFEALTGGDLSRINTSWCLVDENGMPKFTDKAALEAQLDEIRSRLKGKKRFLVGHNLFTDLLFFYQTFVGDLPQSVDGFREKIHGFFPLVADTKYLATFRGGKRNNSSLMDIHDQLKNQKFPKVVMAPGFEKYSGDNMYHEAGYDSFITAENLIKLSVKLFEANVHVDQEKTAISILKTSSIETVRDRDNGASLHPLEIIGKFIPKPRKLTKFASTGMFDQLIDEGDEDTSSSVSTSSDDNGASLTKDADKSQISNTTQSLMDSDIDEVFRGSNYNLKTSVTGPGSDIFSLLKSRAPQFSQHKDQSNDQVTEEKRFKAGHNKIPRFGDPFWKVLGNNLRIFGTEDEVMHLGIGGSGED